MEGWIKLHRKLIEWEWYNDINVKVLFLHLLLTANHEEKKWKGQTILRGQRLTSIEHLAKETNLTNQKIRTALNKLKSTNEITYTSTNKNTLITIEKYEDYQNIKNEDNKQNNIQNNNEITNNQQTNNKQITTNKNEKNIYLYLFNIYKAKIEKEPKRKIQIISELKNNQDYELLTLEEQDKLFIDLMNPEKRSE